MSITCVRCGKKFDKMSGYLINISESLMRRLFDFQEVKNLADKGKHFVYCSDCLEKLLGTSLTMDSMKFKGTQNYWMVSNILYFARKNFGVDSANFKMISLKCHENDECGVIKIPRESFHCSVSSFSIKRFMLCCTCI